jgi:hypothetical protein
VPRALNLTELLHLVTTERTPAGTPAWAQPGSTRHALRQWTADGRVHMAHLPHMALAAVPSAIYRYKTRLPVPDRIVSLRPRRPSPRGNRRAVMQHLNHSPALDDEYSAAYVYNSETRHFCIESWSRSSACPTSAVIVLGGLTDGPLALPYTKQLLVALNSDGRSCCVVQPILSSSYLGYGSSSIEQDCQELDCLVNHLVNHRKKQRVVLLGHSTGKGAPRHS